MTCIVGLSHEGKTWMGADSATSNPNQLDLLGDGGSKICLKKAGTVTCVVGISGSGRMGQLLQHGPDLTTTPPEDASDIMTWLVMDVCKSIRLLLEQEKCIQTKDGVLLISGTLLIGVRERLYEIRSDLQVVPLLYNYGAIGSGYAVALGVLYATDGQEPKERLLKALEASERWNPAVRRPFTFLST